MTNDKKAELLICAGCGPDADVGPCPRLRADCTIRLCREIENTPDNFIGLMRAHVQQGDVEDALAILDNIEAGKYARICGQPVVPGTLVCEGHTNWAED